MQLTKLAVVLLVTALCSAVLSAQQQSGKVIGQVRIARGDFPPHPIFVSLQLRGSTIASGYTDNQGRFGFYELAANTYHVIVNEEAFYAIDEVANIDPVSQPLAILEIHLNPRPASHVDSKPRIAGSNPDMIDLSEYRRHFSKEAMKEFDRGVKADQAHKPEDAIQHYEKAIKLAPDFYPARNNLGSDYLSKSDFAAAQKQFEEAIRLNKDDSQAYFNLGNVLTLTGDLAEAETAIKQGLQKRPDSAFGYFLLGSLYSRAGKGAEGERNLRHAIELDPDMPQVYLQLVNLYVQQNRKTEAIAELQDFLHTFPDGAFSSKAKEVLRKLRTEQQGSAPR